MNWPLWRYSLSHPRTALRWRRRRAADLRWNAWWHAVEAYRVREWR